MEDQIDFSEVKLLLTFDKFLVHPVCKKTHRLLFQKYNPKQTHISAVSEQTRCTPQTPSLVCYNGTRKQRERERESERERIKKQEGREDMSNVGVGSS
jgi:hypothetical protein